MSRCEFNPTTGEPSSDPANPGDCRNEAAFSVGHDGQWHVCADCAALPFFRKYRKRTRLNTGFRSALVIRNDVVK